MSVQNYLEMLTNITINKFSKQMHSESSPLPLRLEKDRQKMFSVALLNMSFKSNDICESQF